LLVSKIEGIFSGTLSYIFNTFGEGQNFSDVVKVAKDLGYTEPDPRDDLSGTDVARKVGLCKCESSLKAPESAWFQPLHLSRDIMVSSLCFSNWSTCTATKRW
jgi:hypothetical protein